MDIENDLMKITNYEFEQLEQYVEGYLNEYMADEYPHIYLNDEQWNDAYKKIILGVARIVNDKHKGEK